MSEELDKFEIERRLAKLEANTQATNEVVVRMDTKLDLWQSNYYPKGQVDEMFKLRDEQIKNVQDDVTTMQTNAATEKQSRRMTFPQWILAVTSVGSVIVAIAAVFRG